MGLAFRRCLRIVAPWWVGLTVFGFVIGGVPQDWALRPYTALMVVGIIVPPLQAAGEEFLIRGLQSRLVASYFTDPRVGAAAAAVVSTATFGWLHGAGDPWLNSFYLTFGLCASWISWRTGGLEAAVALHVVHNLASELLLPGVDFSDFFNRPAGTANASVLVPALVVGVACILIHRQHTASWKVVAG